MAPEVRKRSSCLQVSDTSSAAKLVEERVRARCRLVTAPSPNCDGVERLAVAPDDDVGHLRELGVADPPPERLLPLVHGGSEALRAEPVGERLGVGEMRGC